MPTREFHLGDILSITHDRLLSPRHMEGVYDIAAFMAGEPVWTHQLPRVGKEAAPVILRQHPQLAEIDASGVNGDNHQAWLAEQVARYGETLPIEPMTADDHERIDPMSELAEKVHPDRIIPITV